MFDPLLSKVKRAVERLVAPFAPRYKLNYRGRGVINLIDVGSVGGLPRPWKSNANTVRFLLNFDPNDSPVRGANHLTYNTAVWDEDTTLPFYIYRGNKATGSSLFKQNTEYVRLNFDTLKTSGPRHLAETWFQRSELIRTSQVRCRPLDSILEEEFPDTPFHFMKVDAQGAEYQILRGAKNLLSGSCLGLHLELFRLPLYQGITLMHEVEGFLFKAGFRLAKKFPPHGTFDSQNDCLFLKQSDSPVLQTILKVYGFRP